MTKSLALIIVSDKGLNAMSKGRNTTRVSIRLPDNVIDLLKARADQRNIGFTVLARQIIQKGLGLQQK